MVCLPSSLVGETGPNRHFHFSYQTGAYALRDYRGGVQKVIRTVPGLSDQDVWNAATRRVPATKDLRKAVSEVAFWTGIIQDFDSGRR